MGKKDTRNGWGRGRSGELGQQKTPIVHTHTQRKSKQTNQNKNVKSDDDSNEGHD